MFPTVDYVRLCAMFKAQDPVARRKTPQSLQFCFNCHGSSHTVHHCTSRHLCSKDYGNRHHTLLYHLEAVKTSNITPQESLPTQPTITMATVTPQTALTVTIPDKTALIWSCQVLQDTNGCSPLARAMIDPGSTLSFITGNLANSLKLRKFQFLQALLDFHSCMLLLVILECMLLSWLHKTLTKNHSRSLHQS